MGQYYKPINTANRQYLASWDYNNGAKLMEHSWTKNEFVGAVESLLQPDGAWYKSPIVWAGDYADTRSELVNENLEECNFYEIVKEKNKIKPLATTVKSKYLYNHTKKQFVDKSKTPSDGDGWVIHALPLLTCEGNGRGGGDFGREDPNNLVGAWCNDVISVEKRKPTKKMGFTELIFDLKE